MWKRIVAALKILAGVRPAEAQFDKVDERIAVRLAVRATNLIRERYGPNWPDGVDARPPSYAQILLDIYWAIRLYASHEATYGPQCRDEVEAERVLQATRVIKTGNPEIPS
jgi:hypothetical protein